MPAEIPGTSPRRCSAEHPRDESPRHSSRRLYSQPGGRSRRRGAPRLRTSTGVREDEYAHCRRRPTRGVLRVLALLVVHAAWHRARQVRRTHHWGKAGAAPGRGAVDRNAAAIKILRDAIDQRYSHRDVASASTGTSCSPTRPRRSRARYVGRRLRRPAGPPARSRHGGRTRTSGSRPGTVSQATFPEPPGTTRISSNASPTRPSPSRRTSPGSPRTAAA